MKMKLKNTGLMLFGISVLVVCIYLIDRFSYAKEQVFDGVLIQQVDSIVKVGIIGDSWVAGHKLDSLMHYDLLNKGIKNKIYSSGHPGAKSKLVYKNIFKNISNENSSKGVVLENPDYMLIISGVNDAIGQVGKGYYAYHVNLIIELMLSRSIKPIVVSLPEFEVEKTIDNLDFLSARRNKLSAYFNSDNELDNIKSYRNTLLELITSNGFIDKVIWFDFDKVCEDYNDCHELYQNYSHLSKQGNAKMSDLISKEIDADLNHR